MYQALLKPLRTVRNQPLTWQRLAQERKGPSELHSHGFQVDGALTSPQVPQRAKTSKADFSLRRRDHNRNDNDLRITPPMPLLAIEAMSNCPYLVTCPDITFTLFMRLGRLLGTGLLTHQNAGGPSPGIFKFFNERKSCLFSAMAPSLACLMGSHARPQRQIRSHQSVLQICL